MKKVSTFCWLVQAGNIWTERVNNWLWHPQREELLGARRSFMAICPFHLAEVVKYSKKKLGKWIWRIPRQNWSRLKYWKSILLGYRIMRTCPLCWCYRKHLRKCRLKSSGQRMQSLRKSPGLSGAFIADTIQSSSLRIPEDMCRPNARPADERPSSMFWRWEDYGDCSSTIHLWMVEMTTNNPINTIL